MLYVLAAIGALTVAILLWRAFGPERLGVATRPTIAPDDDPEFLRRLGEQTRRRDDDET
ncbi:hypothetical protein [Goodfellowiella coeruleoviolacea]|uniref:Uncharacterized protein n=1 Tax=Goodfellowiella coeruleoviolacea TaxID=334858 RepID=A0AAE3GGZ4_9PSEU|nr:hypothetical protein [Goodfellowiella coeruleoviolacea]MCP2165958.1 hypothetical protein [Goodfellowiella coeruleoviolacea]